MKLLKRILKAENSFLLIIDTVAVQLEYLKEGISTVNVGQRPYEMGKQSLLILQKLTNGEAVPVNINTGLTYCTQQNADNCTD